MNFEELLRDKPCECGMTHRCSIKHVIVESGAVKKVGSLLDGYRKVLLVADTNTYATCGREVEEQIGARLESVLVYQRDLSFPVDRESAERRVTFLREKHGYTQFAGDNVEYHPSGCLTFPVLGTKARQEDKLAFDPDRSKRRAFYPEVVELFSDYTVFVGGSSSFDMAPKPYNKYYALDLYCREHGLSHENVVFIGDDYGPGGNDESVYLSDFPFICVDDYRAFPDLVKDLL